MMDFITKALLSIFHHQGFRVHVSILKLQSIIEVEINANKKVFFKVSIVL